MRDSKLVVKVVVTYPQGLHARPAQLFTQLAQQFKAEIEVVKEHITADAKSIMHMLSLGAAQNAELTIRAKGEDAQQALETLAAFVKDDFGIKNDEE